LLRSHKAILCDDAIDAMMLPFSPTTGNPIVSPGVLMMTRQVFLVVVGAALFISTATSAEPTPKKELNQVTLIVDYGDGVQKHFTAIGWKEGFTVLDVLRAAQAHPRGIRFEHKGSGDAAMLTRIDDLANEGRARNWMYRVNGKLANSSFGTRQVAAGDSVLWRFE
jgi:hypothetical protein